MDVYGSNSDATAEAYSRHIVEVSGEVGVEIEPDAIDRHELHVGETQSDIGESYTQFSDPEVYRSHMIGNFSLVDGVEEIFRKEDYPVHEIAEAAGHLVSEVPVDGRATGEITDKIVNEYFGAIGLGIYDIDILENDRKILERNLEIQKEFFGDDHVNHTYDRKRVYEEKASQLHDLLSEGQLDEFVKVSRNVHEDLLSEVPSRLSDFEEYSWSRRYDVGTFSEFFIETYITPNMPLEIRNTDVNKDRERMLEKLDTTRELIEDWDKTDIAELRDKVHIKSTENNRAYLIARVLSQEDFKEGLMRSKYLVEQSNSDIWEKIQKESSKLNRELHHEFEIPLFRRDAEDNFSR